MHKSVKWFVMGGLVLIVTLAVYFVIINRAEEKAKGNILCYYLNSNAYKAAPPEVLDPHLCTHIAYAFVNMSESGHLIIQNNAIDIKKRTYHKVTGWKSQNVRLKVLLSIGGVDAKVFSKVASKNESRQNLVKSCKYFMRTYNFDGIDVDWEKPTTLEDKKNFVYLLKELKHELNRGGWILSAAVFPMPSTGYDVPEISRNVDMINLMTYNFYGPWSTYTGQNSALYASSIETPYQQNNLNINGSVNNWINAGASQHKINAGIAFYGRSYTLENETVHGLHAPINKTGYHVYTYGQICAAFSNWTTVWDDEQKNPYKYEGNQWLSYGDERAIREQAKYVVSNNLGGVIVWHIGGDDIKGLCGPKQILLKAINEEMRKS